MNTKTSTALACAVALITIPLSFSQTFAHAQLDKASPPVSGMVSSPSEIRLKFTEGLEPRFCGIALTAETGAAEPLGAVSVDPADNSVLIAKVGAPLPPGVYIVKWRAVSVDTHRTQGSFKFTVKP